MRSWPLTAALLITAQSVLAQVPPDPANGRVLATELCTNCHLVSPDQKGPVVDGIPSFMAIAGQAGQDAQKIQSILLDPPHPLMPSPRIRASTWDELAEYRATSRDQNVEGVMLKRLDSPYVAGRVTGLWWKWKIEPYTCDAVLVYAQRGHGRRASLYTDYTFAAWDDGQLGPFAKAYSGLTDNEIREVDRFVRKHTLEKFGPVRSVQPELVFELAFENIQRSNRHKSGIAVRFPRILRWRHDKKMEEADTLARIRAMLPGQEG